MSVFGQLFSGLINLVLRILNKKNEKKEVFKRIPGRNILCLKITTRISLLTKEQNYNMTDFKLDQQQQENRLVVLFGWLSAKRQHTYKYVDFWIENGFDVLVVTVNALDLLWPVRGTHVIATDTLKLLHENKCYTQILLHGFSAGAYVCTEVTIKMLQNMERYQHILDRIVGQIWDSTTDLETVHYGISTAIFPKNKYLAGALLNYMLLHLKLFENVATRYYRAASRRFHNSIVKAPALLIFSRSDPIGTESTSKLIRRDWESIGIKVDWKVFETSPHVDHFRKHPEEYIAALHGFLDSLHLINSSHTKNVPKNTIKL